MERADKKVQGKTKMMGGGWCWCWRLLVVVTGGGGGDGWVVGAGR